MQEEVRKMIKPTKKYHRQKSGKLLEPTKSIEEEKQRQIKNKRALIGIISNDCVRSLSR
jgi:hypothetical protein